VELAKKVIEEEKRPLSSEEIWEIAKSKGYDKIIASQGKTPWITIAAQLYVNIRDRKDSPFFKADSKPRRFFLKALSKDGEFPKNFEELPPISLRKTHDFSEADLHPFIAYFCDNYLGIHVITIRHSKSTKQEFGEWVHPDMVGFHYPVDVPDEWDSDVVKFGSSIGIIPVKLYSFELKKELTFSNLRQCFFQCVSNSSWANEGYLAAVNISEDQDFRSELKRLTASFGIGIIKIEVEDPDSTAIVFPARSRESLDWETISKLARMNNDFKGFIKRIEKDITTKEIRKEKYDKILSKEELIELIKK
jgi:hypothetical protein